MFDGIINGINLPANRFFARDTPMSQLSRIPKNFHLPLPPALHAGLRDASARLGAPATELAREAIDTWLKEEKRRRVRAEVAAFAEAYAGTTLDCDPAWEAAGLESAANLPPWRNVPADAMLVPAGQRDAHVNGVNTGRTNKSGTKKVSSRAGPAHKRVPA